MCEQWFLWSSAASKSASTLIEQRVCRPYKMPVREAKLCAAIALQTKRDVPNYGMPYKQVQNRPGCCPRVSAGNLLIGSHACDLSLSHERVVGCAFDAKPSRRTTTTFIHHQLSQNQQAAVPQTSQWTPPALPKKPEILRTKPHVKKIQGSPCHCCRCWSR